MSFYPADGLGPGRLYCIDPTKEGDVSPEVEEAPGKAKPNPNSAAVWCFTGNGKRPDERMYETLAGVAAGDGLVVAPDAEGYVHCLDARTGRHYWTHDTQAALLASPLIVDGKVYVADDNGVVTVLALAREKQVLAQNDMEAMTRSAPVFANGVHARSLESRTVSWASGPPPLPTKANVERAALSGLPSDALVISSQLRRAASRT
jgi:hypothetical protein